VVEIIIAVLQGKSPSLQFYATAYNILGNTTLGGGIWIILIIIIGNIINVTIEGMGKYTQTTFNRNFL
jgi:hypothetical protein